MWGISTPTDTSGYPTSCKGKYIVTIVSLSTLKWNTLKFIMNEFKNNNVLDKIANSKVAYLQLPNIIFVKIMYIKLSLYFFKSVSKSFACQKLIAIAMGRSFLWKKQFSFKLIFKNRIGFSLYLWELYILQNNRIFLQEYNSDR